MINWLRSWSNQVIVAVIIATIIEMILPEGNNKKYIKMIIGVYVLFTIIQPVITKLTGNEINFNDFNYSKYFKDTAQVSSSTEQFEDTNSKLIKQTYIDSIKRDIKQKIELKGFKLLNCELDITQDENLLKNIELNLEKIKKDENKNLNNKIQVNEVNIPKNIVSENKKETISDKDKEELKKYLSEEYKIDVNNIKIN